jgi:soluble lytic murein transglycosylase-like protein
VHLDKPASAKFIGVITLITLVVAFVTTFFFIRERYFPQKFRKIIFKEAQTLNLDPFLIAAITYRESGFKETIVSNHGDIGLMQILPITLKELIRVKALDEKEVMQKDLLKGQVNIKVGALYLSYLQKRVLATDSRKFKILNWYEDNTLIPLLISYNAGPTVSLQGYLDHSECLSEYEKVVKKNRPTSWCYAKDIIKIKKRIEWFNHILAYD